MLVRLDGSRPLRVPAFFAVASYSQENLMARETQPTSRDQGRQQTSEMGSATSSHGQQGSGAAGQRGSPTQQTAWQGAGAGQQGSGSALQTRREGLPAWPYSGAFSSPFSMLRRMREDMDRLFDNFSFWRSGVPTDFAQAALPGEGAWGQWSPQLDVREHDGKLIISADLPGMKKEDVNVDITPEAVTIQGERRRETTSDERGYYRSERSYGSFYRTIALPEGADPETASATFRDGVLQIELQVQQQRAKAHRLEIR
jgi:HSP20 family protein